MTSDSLPHMAPQTVPLPAPPPRLLDQVRQAARQRGYPEATGAAFADWGRRLILFHGLRHPRDMGAAEVAQLLTHPAVSVPRELAPV